MLPWPDITVFILRKYFLTQQFTKFHAIFTEVWQISSKAPGLFTLFVKFDVLSINKMLSSFRNSV